MKIAVLTDAHGNLPALEAALAAIRVMGCDVVYHTGDAVGIGPYPAECVERLLSAGVHCLGSCPLLVMKVLTLLRAIENGDVIRGRTG